MSVYKEGYHAISEIQNQSKRIYPDACDFGALVRKNDKLWNLSKQLTECYGEKETRKVNRYSTGATVTQTVSLLDEWNTKKEEKFQVTFVKVEHGIPSSDSIGRYTPYDGYILIEKISK